MRAERDLVNAILHQPRRREQAREHISDSAVLAQPERELYDCLVSQPIDVSDVDLFHVLGPEAGQLLQELRDPELDNLNYDVLFHSSISKIKSREVDEEIKELYRKQTMMTDSEKVEGLKKIADLQHRASELDPARWRVIRK